ncbi:MAG TPA: hydrolase 2, exosortase A system-associated [Nitrosomonas sp.]|nr:hydrolase 2, exosortase A system-associated [Nitrosomonas sp.]
MDSPTLCAEPFFLKVESGERFCLFYRPNLANPLGTFIFIHPFAEEMNKSRRMIAQQSKAFSQNGFAVLQIDLYGCGDSSGEFNEARWEVWKQDIFHAINWIKHQTAAPINLWGLRLGGLLALDLASGAEEFFQHIVLWNPIISGNTFLTQFLRLKVASQLMIKSGKESVGTGALRNKIMAGETLEIAGYELSSILAIAIDKLRIGDFKVFDTKIHWFEVVSEAGRVLSPSAMATVNSWKERNIDLDLQYVTGQAFWATQEIAECPELIEATINQFSTV